jgi:hypothetical protein
LLARTGRFTKIVRVDTVKELFLRGRSGGRDGGWKNIARVNMSYGIRSSFYTDKFQSKLEHILQ